MSDVSYRWLLTGAVLTLLMSGCAIVAKNAVAVDQSTVADMPRIARAASGDFISWREHRIDDQDINGGLTIRGGDGIAIGDIDGDGDEDVVTGGYSGINIIDGAYSGASRDFDDPLVTPASSVGRIAWFENPSSVVGKWKRHDISRRSRGMFDMFVSRDVDGDGDIDLISTRDNSGQYDGVFWLEQVRTKVPAPSFTPARASESQPLPLPPDNWLELYNREQTFVAPNKKDEKR